MLPILFSIGPLKIYTFGVFLTLAFFWGCFFLWKNIRLTAYKEEEVFDMAFISLAFGIFFSRLFYVALNFSDFGVSPLKFILINGYPGLSIYGFIFGFLFGCFTICYLKKIDFFSLVDYFASPAFLALGFGKLGAFFSGTEVGTKTKIFLSLKYFGFDGTRHLTAFYEALLFFFGFYLCWKLLFEVRKEQLFHGFLLPFFAWYFSLVYFLFDKIKENHLYFKTKSFNYWLSLILLLTTSLYFIYYFRSPIKKYGKNFIQTIYFKARSAFKKARRKDKKTD